MVSITPVIFTFQNIFCYPLYAWKSYIFFRMPSWKWSQTHDTATVSKRASRFLVTLVSAVIRQLEISFTQNLCLIYHKESSHKTWLVQLIAMDLNIETLPYQRCSPELTPSDVFVPPNSPKYSCRLNEIF